MNMLLVFIITVHTYYLNVITDIYMVLFNSRHYFELHEGILNSKLYVQKTGAAWSIGKVTTQSAVSFGINSTLGYSN